jgi:hypothetical protein
MLKSALVVSFLGQQISMMEINRTKTDIKEEGRKLKNIFSPSA